ncbi:O-antigen ligase family protein [Streptomyces sp. NBC_01483]|uniref:O-antigen ligase family protein n=1 Tax=Streptomyces sp. NBC_01483 TaxID=2903883 RepID=UPI002E369EEF|nr:O-antigen ligase family protein [Streptomyces sp. NBC_01483]
MTVASSLPEQADVVSGWLPHLPTLAVAAAVITMRWRRRDGSDATPLLVRLGCTLVLFAVLDALVIEVRAPRFTDETVAVPHAGLLDYVQKALLTGLIVVSVACIVLSATERLSGRVLVKRSAAVAVLPFSGAWAASTALGAWPGANVQAWVAWATFTALSCLPVTGQALAAQARLLLRALIWGSLVVAELAPSWAFAPYELWPGGWRVDVPRLAGLTPHPNTLGWLAAFAFLLEWSLSPTLTTKLARIAPATTCLVLSGSRTALVALLVGAMFQAAGRSRDAAPHTSAGTWMRRAVVLVAGAGVAFHFLRQDSQEGGTFNGRARYWTKALQAWLDFPVFGTGPGAYYTSVNTTEAVSYTHNQLLHTAAELGSVGLIALLWLTLRSLWNARRGESRAALTVAVTLTALFATENPLRFTNLAFLVPLLPPLLLILATQRVSRPFAVVTDHARVGTDRFSAGRANAAGRTSSQTAPSARRCTRVEPTKDRERPVAALHSVDG